MESHRVALNVGGTIFETTTGTLGRVPSAVLDKIRSEAVDCENGYFIDRDPTVFKYILNFLRDKRVVFPDDGLTSALIYQEAKYYGLDDLAQLIARGNMNATGYVDIRL